MRTLELTLDSFLSPGGFVGHLSYVLLVLSMMSQRMIVLRVLVILSGLTGIAYDGIWLGNPVGVTWEAALVLVNLVQLWRMWHADRGARFADEERTLVDERLRLASRGAARRLLDTGDWVDLAPGTRLTEEGARPEALHFLVSGQVDILRLGHRLAGCGAGTFVGEMALLESDGVASATSVVTEPARAWRLPYAKLERMQTAQPEAHGALQAAIARDMRLKIVAHNAERVGV